VIFTASCSYKANWDSFDIYDYYHVILEQELLRQSRDSFQSNGQEAENYALAGIL